MSVKLWKVLLVLLLVGVLAGGGYGLYRAGYARGYVAGLAENIDASSLETFFMGRFDEHFGPGGWGHSFGPGSRFPFMHGGYSHGWAAMGNAPLLIFGGEEGQ